ncbi:MAG: hypothetical protein ABJF04_11135 [Reichenbachiella sp.]|uniref:hypothetical protein n=1 Tax=Reichenbachiella sp. TaxID=2184521 RepID=UPI003264B946
MRLGTLARKISITPSKLTAYLESQAIDLSSGTNTKLTEEQIEVVLKHFDATLEVEPPVDQEETPDESPQQGDASNNDEAVEKEVEEAEVPLDENELTKESESKESELQEEPESQAEESPTALISDSFAEVALPHEIEDQLTPIEPEPEETISDVSIEEQSGKKDEEVEETEPKAPVEIDPEIESSVERAAYDDSIEVIKPPKVKLPGLKVKGKIDLPEPKVASEPVEEEKEEEKKTYDPDEIITTTGPKRDRKRRPKNYKGKKYNKDYSPLEAARKKKEWEEKKRKEQEERRKKKAKARHYKKTVVPAATAPPVTKKKPKKVALKKKQKQAEPTGNVLQRFWRWMNT